MSGVSTIDSPCSEYMSDPVTESGSEEQEFSTVAIFNPILGLRPLPYWPQLGLVYQGKPSWVYKPCYIREK